MNTEELKLKEVSCNPELDPYHRDTCGQTKTRFWIDPQDNEYGVEQVYDDNCTSFDEWNSIVLAFYTGFRPDEDSVRLLLESDEGKNLVARVIDGWDSDWNGNNIIGSLNEDAILAWDDLTRQLNHMPENEWGIDFARNFFYDCDWDEITAFTMDGELERLAYETNQDVKEEFNMILYDTYEYLESIRREKILETEE